MSKLPEKFRNDEEVKTYNPWKKYPKFDHLYNDDNISLIHEIDKEEVEKYNKKKDEDHIFITWIPAIPFQGNPFTAKVIFLSLNPGYVEKLNKDVAKFLKNNCNEMSKNLANRWYEHLTHQVKSMMPSKEKEEDLYTAFQLIGDWYWVERLKHIQKDTSLNDDVFFGKFALIELMPYSSKHCANVTTKLPTQKYTKELIKYLLNRTNKPLFVVMRSEDSWEKLLGIRFKDYNNFILRKRDSNGHRPRSQHITKEAFENNGYERIIEAIKQ